ncbi:restriction endonuclease subunit S [Tranquillimonas alkanivorans]|uniref:Type I restriction enzyme, S subunit n=1 Tax=Tranquillimonas alkanivorans TaxID=441119 RepID=A0A1I5W0M0_9RHOB|nr:restriction endonuclease subunit S [Tranquillimonas alkanivorans]SFQ13230.1 type I restriction enzyme, S subunit [Tranquillimonas alkanivorans]
MKGKLRLGDHCTKIGSGATPRGGKSSYLPHGPFSLIRSQNVLNDRFSKEGLAYINEEQARRLDSVEVCRGDVLLNITGDSVARVCQVADDALPARVNQHVAIIRPDSATIDPRYLRYFMVTPSFQDFLMSMASSGATRNALTKGMIEDFEIPYRPIEEQREIGTLLGALDDKIELNLRMSATLEEMARTLYRSWFVNFDPVHARAVGQSPAHMDATTAGLFPDSFDPVGLPKGWREGEVGDLITLQRGFDLPKKDRLDGPYPVMAAGGHHGTHNEFKVKGPGVTTGRSGVIGQVYLVTHDFWPLNTSLWIKEFKGCSPYFAYFFLGALDLSALNSGSAVPSLNRNNVHNLPADIPPANIISAFDGVVLPMFSRQHQLDSEVGVIVALRDALLPRLMSGQLRIREAEKQVEEVL